MGSVSVVCFWARVFCKASFTGRLYGFDAHRVVGG